MRKLWRNLMVGAGGLSIAMSAHASSTLSFLVFGIAGWVIIWHVADPWINQ